METNQNKPLTRGEEFENAVKPLMDWLNDENHPHMSVIITSQNAELVEGQMSYNRKSDDIFNSLASILKP